MLSQSPKYYKDYNDVWWCPFSLLLLLPYTLLICVLNMIILYNINEGRSRCLFEHASKGKTENTTLTLFSTVWSRLVSNQKKKIKIKRRRRKSKKKGVRNLTTTCMFSIIHVFYIKQTC